MDKKVLEYLGMKIDYRQKGKVKFSMYEYIKKNAGRIAHEHGRTGNNPSV